MGEDSVICTYHGWTYQNDGKLIGVPALQDSYLGELDLDQWGLIEVPRVDTHADIIFACCCGGARFSRHRREDWMGR